MELKGPGQPTRRPASGRYRQSPRNAAKTNMDLILRIDKKPSTTNEPTTNNPIRTVRPMKTLLLVFAYLLSRKAIIRRATNTSAERNFRHSKNPSIANALAMKMAAKISNPMKPPLLLMMSARR